MLLFQKKKSVMEIVLYLPFPTTGGAWVMLRRELPESVALRRPVRVCCALVSCAKSTARGEVGREAREREGGEVEGEVDGGEVDVRV